MKSKLLLLIGFGIFLNQLYSQEKNPDRSITKNYLWQYSIPENKNHGPVDVTVQASYYFIREAYGSDANYDNVSIKFNVTGMRFSGGMGGTNGARRFKHEGIIYDEVKMHYIDGLSDLGFNNVEITNIDIKFPPVTGLTDAKYFDLGKVVSFNSSIGKIRKNADLDFLYLNNSGSVLNVIWYENGGVLVNRIKNLNKLTEKKKEFDELVSAANTAFNKNELDKAEALYERAISLYPESSGRPYNFQTITNKIKDIKNKKQKLKEEEEEKKEQERKEQERKEQEKKEQEKKEQERKEQERKEQERKEQERKEQEKKEQEDKEQEDKEQEEKEQEDKDKVSQQKEAKTNEKAKSPEELKKAEEEKKKIDEDQARINLKISQAYALEKEGDKYHKMGSMFYKNAYDLYQRSYSTWPLESVKKKIAEINNLVITAKAIEKVGEKVDNLVFSLDPKNRTNSTYGFIQFNGLIGEAYQSNFLNKNRLPADIWFGITGQRLFLSLQMRMGYMQSGNLEATVEKNVRGSWNPNSYSNITTSIIDTVLINNNAFGLGMSVGINIPIKFFEIYGLYGFDCRALGISGELFSDEFRYKEKSSLLSDLPMFQSRLDIGLNIRVPKTKFGIGFNYSFQNLFSGGDLGSSMEKLNPTQADIDGTNFYNLNSFAQKRYKYWNLGLKFIWMIN